MTSPESLKPKNNLSIWIRRASVCSPSILTCPGEPHPPSYPPLTLPVLTWALQEAWQKMRGQPICFYLRGMAFSQGGRVGDRTRDRSLAKGAGPVQGGPGREAEGPSVQLAPRALGLLAGGLLSSWKGAGGGAAGEGALIGCQARQGPWLPSPPHPTPRPPQRAQGQAATNWSSLPRNPFLHSLMSCHSAPFVFHFKGLEKIGQIG